MEDNFDPKDTQDDETTEETADEIIDKTTDEIIDETTDENEALLSLDETTIRPLPELSAVWEPLDGPTETPAPESTTRARVRMAVLVGAVAVVSFIAGGVTARLSSQMPVLFAQAPEPVESTASYEPPAEPVTPVIETAPQDEPQSEPTPPSYDTGDDTADDSWPEVTKDNDQSDKQWTDDGKDDDGYDDGQSGEQSDDPWYYYRWQDDSQKDDSWNDDSWPYGESDDNDSEDEGDSSELHWYVYDYGLNDQGTGYDTTEPERDYFGWRV